MNKALNLILTVIAIASIAVGFLKLNAATSGLVVQHVSIGSTPATVFRLANAPPGPVVVIAHGFAGSQELMQSFADTLARNGYAAVTFDFLGHGKNPEPIHGSITDPNGATKALVDQLADVAKYARTLPGSDGDLALLGHSMATDIVVRLAQSTPSINATIAVSMFSPGVTRTSPKNLLVIVGNLEPQIMKDQGWNVVKMAASGPTEQRVTYGSFADGSARRVSFSRGVEHIGVLYSRDSLVEALNWLNAVYHRRGSGFVDVRGPWLGLLFFGLVALARPLSQLLPRIADQPLGAGLGWRKLLPVAIAPAILTPLILWKAPTDFLPLMLGDYLVVHFAIYGVLTALGLWIACRGEKSFTTHTSLPIKKLAVAAILVALYSIVALGVPIDTYLASFIPISRRVPLILAMLVGTLPYFVADEWLTRGASAPRGSYAFTKFCFLVSLAIAVVLNLQKLFFLIIIAVIILLFFIIYGLFSRWSYNQTRYPLIGALSNAVAFAWAIAVTFPLLAR